MHKPRPVEPHPPLSDYYGNQTQRPAFVRNLFDHTARYYDGINNILSLGSGNWYRRRALLRAGLQPNMVVLDVATGTGLVARQAAKITGPENVLGLDVSSGMLREAKRKLDIALTQGIVEALPVADESVDFVSMGYALRHAADLAITFREFHRVLRPGGKVLLLEIAKPAARLRRGMVNAYLGRLIPLASKWATGDKEAATLMRYYWDTIDHCVPAQTIVSALLEAGFCRAGVAKELGIFSAYSGCKV